MTHIVIVQTFAIGLKAGNAIIAHLQVKRLTWLGLWWLRQSIYRLLPLVAVLKCKMAAGIKNIFSCSV